MDKYSKSVDTSNYNITINGVDFIMEDPSPNQAYNTRELSRHDIIGGTQHTIRTTYKVRDFTFRLHLRIDPLHPDIYNSMFIGWINEPCEIICAYMGGKFNAEVSVKPVPVGNYLEVDVQVIEIPETKSTIPNDSLDTPADKHIEIISSENTEALQKEIKETENQIKQLEKQPQTKETKEEKKTLKDKLKKLQKKMKNTKSKSVKTSDINNVQKNKNKNKTSNVTKTKETKTVKKQVITNKSEADKILAQYGESVDGLISKYS